MVIEEGSFPKGGGAGRKGYRGSRWRDRGKACISNCVNKSSSRMDPYSMWDTVLRSGWYFVGSLLG